MTIMTKASNFLKVLAFAWLTLKGIHYGMQEKPHTDGEVETRLIDCPVCGFPADVIGSAQFFNRKGEVYMVRDAISCSGEHPPFVLSATRPDFHRSLPSGY